MIQKFYGQILVDNSKFEQVQEKYNNVNKKGICGILVVLSIKEQ